MRARRLANPIGFTRLMQVNIDTLGFVAATFTTIAFIPQVVLVWRQRAAPGISTGMYIFFLIGIALWTCYGLLLMAWPLIIANSLTLVLAGSVLAMKLVFERGARD
jgi:MtN3 and saliva related transmembrane protein